MDAIPSEAAPGAERFSVARLAEYWYVACRSGELRRRPLARTVLGTPLVLFRDAAGAPAALLDRCAHRNAPLSRGRTIAGEIACPYHGWRYDGSGACRLVPGLRGETRDARARSVPACAVVERQGFVWVCPAPGKRPQGEPFDFPLLGRPGYASVPFEFEVEAALHAAIENMLDVPHTAFLHRGLFRGGRRNEITAVVRRWRDRVEAEYVGEPRPSGLVARLLAPGSEAAVTHFDRFLLPSISQVEYRLGDRHLLACAALTPVGDFRTRVHAVVSFRLPLPALVRLVVTPLARRIFQQDAAILRLQTETVRRFGGERYASTELDLLGPHVWRLLRDGEGGAIAPDAGPPAVERQVTFLA